MLCMLCCKAQRVHALQSSTHLIELHHCRSLDKGSGISYVNAILPGVEGRQVPHYIPSMEDPDVIVMPLRNCGDLAKSNWRLGCV